MNDADKRPRRPRRGEPQRATPEALEKAALAYLERYASSAENLRRVLGRRVERSARAHGTDREAGRRWIDDIISRYERAGLLDDARYAEMRAASLMRKGYGNRRVAQSLRAKGVPETAIRAALDSVAEEDGDPELAAALKFARRRRLGPFRPASERAARRARDLAAMARTGFDYDVARRVIDGDDIQALETEAKGD